MTIQAKIQTLATELALELEKANELFYAQDWEGVEDGDLEDASMAAQDLAGDLNGMDERMSLVIEMLERIE